MVHRGLVSSTGRSDYIYAGTQVLLNTPFFALRLPLASPHPAPLSSLVLPGSSPGTNGYLLYNSHNMFVSACTCPQQHVKQKRKSSLSSLINCSSVHKRLLNGDVKAPLERSVLVEAAQPLCQWKARSQEESLCESQRGICMICILLI